jgi:hypothetical protein
VRDYRSIPLPLLSGTLATPRICPGRHFALRTVYIIVACVLTVFDIEPALDEDGNLQLPKVEFDCTLIRYVLLLVLVVVMLTVAQRYIRTPKPFKCAIRPRSDDAVKLVKEAYGRTGC